MASFIGNVLIRGVRPNLNFAVLIRIFIRTRNLPGCRVMRGTYYLARDFPILRVPGQLRGPTMDDRQRREDAELRRIIIQKIAHDLSMVYAVETQLPPRLQAFLQRLDETQEHNQ